MILWAAVSPSTYPPPTPTSYEYTPSPQSKATPGATAHTICFGNYTPSPLAFNLRFAAHRRFASPITPRALFHCCSSRGGVGSHLLRQLYSEPIRFDPTFDCSPSAFPLSFPCSPTICFANYTPSSLALMQLRGRVGRICFDNYTPNPLAWILPLPAHRLAFHFHFPAPRRFASAITPRALFH